MQSPRRMTATPANRAAAGAARKQKKFVPTPAIPEDAAVHVPVRRWRVPQHYDLRSTLGSGAYGTVCEAFDQDAGRVVAIKRVPRLFDDLVVAKRVLREVAILARLNHPNVVRLYDLAVPHDDTSHFNELFLVMEIGDTDLKALMETDIAFTPQHVKWIFCNLLRGVKYIHSVGVYHRDLKPSNVLVNADCAVKICDFGLARAVSKRTWPVTPIGSLPLVGQGSLCESPASSTRHAHRVMTRHVATRHYRAPEIILLQHGYTEAIDVWSAGCIYAEMAQLLGTHPKARGPLFPGATCFPLSPDAGRPCDGVYHSRRRREQLNVIFDVLGTPSEEEVNQLDREDAQHYIRCFAPRAGRGLQQRLPFADAESVELLEQMLRFGQDDRISAEAALQHRIFIGIPSPNKLHVPSGPVELSHDEEHDLCEQDLRDCLCRELVRLSGPSAKVKQGGA